MFQDSFCSYIKMSTEADHICGELPSDRNKPKLFNNREECQNNSGVSKIHFTCGACLTKFRTACRLHYHLEHHQEGGSYTYDHITKTAFPKHDSICAYTQVEQNLVLVSFVEQNTDKNEKQKGSVEEYDHEIHKGIGLMNKDEVRESHSEGTRKSKRIELRRNKKETKPIAAGIEIDKFLSEQPGVENSGHQQISTADSITKTRKDTGGLKAKTTKDNEGLKDKKVTKTRKYGTCKRKKLDAEEIPKNLQVDKAEDSNAVQDSKNLPKNENMNIAVHNKPKNEAAKETPENVNHVEQNTDEITASEALIAISKSVDGENLKNIINNETDIKTEVTKNQSRLRYNTDHSSSDISNSQRIQPNGLIENRKDSSEIPDYLDNDGDDKSIIETLKLDKGQTDLAERTDKRECPVCGKYGTRSMLSYHKHLHKDQKEHSCDKCGKQFQHPSCLKVHLRSHEEKLYKCEKCSEKFSRKKYLETHLLKHSGEKPYMCETCGKAYRDEMHLKRHIKHVHKQIRSFECDICKDRFFRSDHLKCHRTRHFEPGFMCTFCNKKFKLHVDLQRHVVVHTGAKNWYCHLCGEGFRWPVSYYNHMKKKHDIERLEAVKWRKKKIEENKRKKDVTFSAVGENISKQSGKISENQRNSGEDILENSDMTCMGQVNLSTEKAQVRKIYVKQECINYDTDVSVRDITSSGLNVSTEAKYKVLRNASVTCSTNSSSEVEPCVYMQANGKGYRLIRVSNSGNNKSVKEQRDTKQETESSDQGEQYPLIGAFAEVQDSVTVGREMAEFEDESHRTVGTEIAEFDDGSHLQNEQIVVMEEETEGEVIGMMPDLEGENIQAVMFIDDNECAGEVVIDQEITI